MDGNGLIEVSDCQVILDNFFEIWGEVVFFELIVVIFNNFILFVEILNEGWFIGQVFNLLIVLGIFIFLVEGFYGIVFIIEFDLEIICFESIVLDFINSWLGDEN